MLAQVVVEPALLAGIVEREPAAVAALDEAVRAHVVGKWIKRVKFWRADGLVVYSDDPRVDGKTFPLSEDHRAVLAHPELRAEVTDLNEPENMFEREEGKLLEVYRQVKTRDGQLLVMETYSPYEIVNDRIGPVWRDFASITIASLLVLVLLLLPVLWRLNERLRQAQAQREALLERAVNASAEERRRIAATLHDGMVQELTGASFVVSGAAVRAESAGQESVAEVLRSVASTVRTCIGGLRSLLVDIYPPSLASTGLDVALTDLVASLRTRDIDVRLDARGTTGLSKETERLVFRVAQECLRNAARHSRATRVGITLSFEGRTLVMDVTDNGVGFDAEKLLSDPKKGHFGLRLMADATAQGHGELRVATAPGAGTHWQLRLDKDLPG